MKLREGNIFSVVSPSVQGSDHYPWCQWLVIGYVLTPLDLFKRFKFGTSRTVYCFVNPLTSAHSPPNYVHYLAYTSIGKRTFSLRLKSILVFFSTFCMVKVNRQIMTVEINKCYIILICDLASNLIVIERLYLSEELDSSWTWMHLEIIFTIYLIWMRKAIEHEQPVNQWTSLCVVTASQ